MLHLEVNLVIRLHTLLRFADNIGYIYSRNAFAIKVRANTREEMDSKANLRYHSIQSFADSSFFTALSQRKLNDYKLDTSPKLIYGFETKPVLLNKFNDRPVINLDNGSFDPESQESTTSIEGVLYNFNTIEEFKSTDKRALMAEWGKALLADLKEGKLNRKFRLLVFSDLKKYKFYYWLAFPLLHSAWSNEVVELTEVDSEIINSVQRNLKEHPGMLFQAPCPEEPLIESFSEFREDCRVFVFVDRCFTSDSCPSVYLKNCLYALALKGFERIELIVYRAGNRSFKLVLSLDETFDASAEPQVTGWEKTLQGKLGAKMADLGSLINPEQLADQAVDLNLKLMKWRVAPHIDLETIKNQKVLLLGAGTLGSYVSRALMGWGVRQITLVDNGRVSYSNPVRQPLFKFQDCFSDEDRGCKKAIRAAESLKEIFPGMKSEGYDIEVPMIGHPVSEADGERAQKNYGLLKQLFAEHDAIFLLMDSRESRWLPTVMGAAMNKVVVNAALGYDSYLVMRHSPSDMDDRLGCYYCNDVVAPKDSLSDRTLDQMCTVTRPGGALTASSLAVELFVSILQHPDKHRALFTAASKFGDVPHQIRGSFHTFSQMRLNTPAYDKCSACSKTVIDLFKAQDWTFVKNCLDSSDYLEEVCGLKKIQEEAEIASQALMEDLSLSDEDSL